MIKIKVLREFNHEGKKIYIRRIGKLFEYLLLYDNRLFNHYIDAKPDWYRLFLAEPYTEKQIESIIRLLLKGAMTSIELLDKQKCQKVIPTKTMKTMTEAKTRK